MDIKKSLGIILSIVLFLLIFCKEEQTFNGGKFDYYLNDSKIKLQTEKKRGGFYVNLSNKEVDFKIKYKTTREDLINIVLDKSSDNIYILNSEYIDKIIRKDKYVHVIDHKKYDSLFWNKRKETDPRILKDDFIHVYIFTMDYFIFADDSQKSIKIK
jgi:hypothetical protein